MYRKIWLCLTFCALSACFEEETTQISNTNTPKSNSDSRTALKCEIMVIGGGAGGLHTAFRLAADHGSQVCLFEKEDHLGGRILDVSMDGSQNGPFFGAGARRIMEGQQILFDLADELGMTYESAAWQDDLISARGYTTFNSDDINRAAFPRVDDELDSSPDDGSETETALYNLLRFGPERQHAAEYADFRSYVRTVVGPQGYHFLTDVFRFRADFEYPLDARGYLDYLDEEWDVCCTASYPVGGMSEYIRRMEAAAIVQQVRIFKSEPAISITKVSGGYRVTTPNYSAMGNNLVVAVDAEAFKHVSGDIAEAIKNQPQFQQLIGVKVVTVAQWWPNRWWEGALGKNVRRAWTTEHCLNHIEIPVDSYGVAQNVTRSVYDDDMRCVEFWEQTAKRSTNAVAQEIRRGLQEMFPGVEIPLPLKTYVKVWPAAWYWLKAGSPYTNADIARWALEPMPGEAISMVGESYNPQRSGWSDAAYKSSIATLNAHFGYHYDGAAASLEDSDSNVHSEALHAFVPHSRSMSGH